MITLNVTVEGGTIIDVGSYRHRVNWHDRGESQITYCNNCGSGLILEIDGKDFCAQCGMDA